MFTTASEFISFFKNTQMKKSITLLLLVIALGGNVMAQHIPMDVMNINHQAFLITCKEAAPIVARKENQTSFLSSMSLLDSTYSWSWDSLSGSWTPIEKSIYGYDASYHQTIETNQIMNSITWINHYQFVYTYDANNNQLTRLH